jgi:peptidylprolyl isomerase
VVTPSGLQAIDIVAGTGSLPAAGDTMVVNYTGWLASDGTMFDSSLDGTEPFTFVLGQGGVIAGWDEGVSSMLKGGKRRLIVPPDLAYGEAGRPPTIPASATLIFDIDLIEIFPATPAAATETPAAEVSPSP